MPTVSDINSKNVRELVLSGPDTFLKFMHEDPSQRIIIPQPKTIIKTDGAIPHAIQKGVASRKEALDRYYGVPIVGQILSFEFEKLYSPLIELAVQRGGEELNKNLRDNHESQDKLHNISVIRGWVKKKLDMPVTSKVSKDNQAALTLNAMLKKIDEVLEWVRLFSEKLSEKGKKGKSAGLSLSDLMESIGIGKMEIEEFIIFRKGVITEYRAEQQAQLRQTLEAIREVNKKTEKAEKIESKIANELALFYEQLLDYVDGIDENFINEKTKSGHQAKVIEDLKKIENVMMALSKLQFQFRDKDLSRTMQMIKKELSSLNVNFSDIINNIEESISKHYFFAQALILKSLKTEADSDKKAGSEAQEIAEEEQIEKRNIIQMVQEAVQSRLAKIAKIEENDLKAKQKEAQAKIEQAKQAKQAQQAQVNQSQKKQEAQQVQQKQESQQAQQKQEADHLDSEQQKAEQLGSEQLDLDELIQAQNLLQEAQNQVHDLNETAVELNQRLKTKSAQMQALEEELEQTRQKLRESNEKQGKEKSGTEALTAALAQSSAVALSYLKEKELEAKRKEYEVSLASNKDKISSLTRRNLELSGALSEAQQDLAIKLQQDKELLKLQSEKEIREREIRRLETELQALRDFYKKEADRWKKEQIQSKYKTDESYQEYQKNLGHLRVLSEKNEKIIENMRGEVLVLTEKMKTAKKEEEKMRLEHDEAQNESKKTTEAQADIIRKANESIKDLTERLKEVTEVQEALKNDKSALEKRMLALRTRFESNFADQQELSRKLSQTESDHKKLINDLEMAGKREGHLNDVLEAERKLHSQEKRKKDDSLSRIEEDNKKIIHKAKGLEQEVERLIEEKTKQEQQQRDLEQRLRKSQETEAHMSAAFNRVSGEASHLRKTLELERSQKTDLEKEIATREQELKGIQAKFMASELNLLKEQKRLQEELQITGARLQELQSGSKKDKEAYDELSIQNIGLKKKLEEAERLSKENLELKGKLDATERVSRGYLELNGKLEAAARVSSAEKLELKTKLDSAAKLSRENLESKSKLETALAEHKKISAGQEEEIQRLRTQEISDRNNLEKEKDINQQALNLRLKAQEEIDKLTEENLELLRDKEAWIKDREGVLEEIKRLRDENQSFIKERTELKDKNDNALDMRSMRIMRLRHKLAEKNSKLDQLKKDFDAQAITVKHQEAQLASLKLSHESELKVLQSTRAAEEHKLTQDKGDALNKMAHEKAALTRELQSVLDQATKEKDARAQEQASVAKEKESWAREQATAAKEKEAWTQQQRAWAQEKEALMQQGKLQEERAKQLEQQLQVLRDKESQFTVEAKQNQAALGGVEQALANEQLNRKKKEEDHKKIEAELASKLDAQQRKVEEAEETLRSAEATLRAEREAHRKEVAAIQQRFQLLLEQEAKKHSDAHVIALTQLKEEMGAKMSQHAEAEVKMSQHAEQAKGKGIKLEEENIDLKKRMDALKEILKRKEQDVGEQIIQASLEIRRDTLENSMMIDDFSTRLKRQQLKRQEGEQALHRKLNRDTASDNARKKLGDSILPAYEKDRKKEKDVLGNKKQLQKNPPAPTSEGGASVSGSGPKFQKTTNKRK